MKANILKAIVAFGITTAAAIIIAKYKKNAAKKILANLSDSIDERHIPNGRHSIVKRRALEMLHAGN